MELQVYWLSPQYLSVIPKIQDAIPSGAGLWPDANALFILIFQQLIINNRLSARMIRPDGAIIRYVISEKT